MQQVIVKMPNTGTEFRYDLDLNTYVCTHAEAYMEAACCSGYDSEGNISCGCYGLDRLLCPAVDCTGIEDWEYEEVIKRVSD